MDTKNPDYLHELIEKATEKAGSQAQLARLIGVYPPNVTAWKQGKPCPVADQVLMANIAGLNAEEWAARALVQHYEGTEKGERLKVALKKLLPAIGAAVASSGASAGTLIYSTAWTSAHLADWLTFGIYTMIRKVKLQRPLTNV